MASEAISEQSILTNFSWGNAPEGPPYSAGPIQFCFRRACLVHLLPSCLHALHSQGWTQAVDYRNTSAAENNPGLPYRQVRRALRKGQNPPEDCIKIELFCSCQMPETYGDMIACDKCGDWYHMDCVGLERPPPKQEQWNCSKKSTVGNPMAPLIPRIESAEVGSKSLAYLIRPGSDLRGDWICFDTDSKFRVHPLTRSLVQTRIRKKLCWSTQTARAVERPGEQCR